MTAQHQNAQEVAEGVVDLPQLEYYLKDRTSSHYVVLKEDMKYLDPEDQRTLRDILEKLKDVRESQGKNPEPTYLVTLYDEKWLTQAIAKMKDIGAWENE